MFEPTKLISGPLVTADNGLCTDGRKSAARRRRWRGGDALRAVDWSEITARLNAARDLRLQLRGEMHTPIEGVAASFGDAAASYFAFLGDREPGVNRDRLGQPKMFSVMLQNSDTNRASNAAGGASDADHGDAREMQ